MAGVLLATDGSEHARKAAERAVEIASNRDVPLTVLCVVDRRVHGEPGLSASELTSIEAEDVGHDCVAEVRQMVADRKVEVAVDGAVRHGIPEDVILEAAAEDDVDVIVIGEHGNHTKHLGGVGRRLVRDSPYDVEIVTLEGTVEPAN